MVAMSTMALCCVRRRRGAVEAPLAAARELCGAVVGIMLAAYPSIDRSLLLLMARPVASGVTATRYTRHIIVNIYVKNKLYIIFFLL